MAVTTFVFAYVAILFVVYAESNDIVTLMKDFDRRLAKLEEKHQTEIATLTKEFALKVENLEKRVELLEEANVALLEENGRINERKDRSQAHQRKARSDLLKAKREAVYTAPETISPNYRPTRVVGDGFNTAFSAYLDHDANGYQTIVFNQVLLNDGGAYNKTSGIFTAPMTGVYSFSFFLGERDNNGIWAALWVNNENKIDAAVDTIHNTQDLQGGNVVNLKLVKNDNVFIKHIGEALHHIEGSNKLRLSSFSGFLLYPIEDGPAVVVGK